ncbi:MAG: ABC transporter permease [Pseudomarimonas sp.]
MSRSLPAKTALNSWLASLLLDLRLSIRMLLTRPGFALAVIATLALAIGANTAVFSAIEGRLLRPLPYPDSERLVYIHNTYPKRGVDDSGNTVPDYLDRRQHATALEDSAIYYDYSYDLVEQGAPMRVAGIAASPSLFTTLGVQAALGRTFTESEGVLGSERVVLLSHALWRNQFAADPDMVGRDLRISGQNYRVVGVMPASFAFPRREIALWVPFAWTEKQQSDAMRGFEFAQSIGRLKADASIEQLNAQFDAIVVNNVRRFAGSTKAPNFAESVSSGGFTGRARNLHAQLVGDVGATLWMLQAAVFLLLLIACANVANLLLMRFSARRHELGVRMALGASRLRIARQLLVEGSVLAGAGGMLGILVAYAGIGLIRWLRLDGAEQGFVIGISLPVLGFAVAAAMLSALLFACLPLLALGRKGELESLHGGGRGSVGSHAARLPRRALVVLQISLAVALLGGTGLLAHSVWRLQQVSPGFSSDGVLTVSLNLSRERYRDLADTRRFNQQVMTAIRELPGVTSAGAVGQLPFSSDYGSVPYFVEGQQTGADSGVIGNIQIADHDYFRTLQIPLLRGRGFSASDSADAAPVVIIDHALAQRSFADRDPLGQRIGTAGVDGATHWLTVVGVVQSIKTQQLSEQAASPTFYLPIQQNPPRIFRIVVKSQLAPAQLAEQLRAAVAKIDPEQPIWDVQSLSDRVDSSLTSRRTPMALLLLFAGVALALSVIGIYGVLGHAVAQRSSEIGVRMALGAGRSAILRWVLAEGGRLLTLGLIVGTVMVVLLGHQLQIHLFEVNPLDPVSLLGVLLLVGAVGLFACWIPAQRAASVSPMQALRDS